MLVKLKQSMQIQSHCKKVKIKKIKYVYVLMNMSFKLLTHSSDMTTRPTITIAVFADHCSTLFLVTAEL